MLASQRKNTLAERTEREATRHKAAAQRGEARALYEASEQVGRGHGGLTDWPLPACKQCALKTLPLPSVLQSCRGERKRGLTFLSPKPCAVEMSDSLKAFISGGCGGAALVLVGQPFHGVARGLYRGTAPVLAGVAPVFALCFWAFAEAKAALRALSGARSDRELSLLAVGLAGAMSAVPTTLIMAPGERIKIVMQTNAGFRGGATGVARQLLRTGGVRSLFRGSAATLLRDGAGSTAYFSVYEGLRRALTPAGAAEPPTAAVLLAGGAAGAANWLVALPVDAVKSRIQWEPLAARLPAAAAAAYEPAPPMRAVAARLYREGGLRAFYRGLGAVMLRALPANAACFFAMEESRKALDRLF